MKPDEAIAKLRQHEADLRKLGAKSLYLFGSTARGEARSDSDVDLFFDYDPDRVGLRELFRIKDSAPEFLGCKADVTTRDSINPFIRPYAEGDAIRVF
jgi:predicted nucleotidyltransferase